MKDRCKCGRIKEAHFKVCYKCYLDDLIHRAIYGQLKDYEIERLKRRNV